MNIPRHHSYALSLLNDILAAIGQPKPSVDEAADLAWVTAQLQALSEDARTRGEPFGRRMASVLAMLQRVGS